MTKAPAKTPPVAVIDEQACIGCTLCIEACPVDAIVGAAGHMHTVIAAGCTGCGWCLPPCPVDCITLIPTAESLTHEERKQRAAQYRRRYQARQSRIRRERADLPEAGCRQNEDQGKRAVIERVMQRARQRLQERKR